MQDIIIQGKKWMNGSEVEETVCIEAGKLSNINLVLQHIRDEVGVEQFDKALQSYLEMN